MTCRLTMVSPSSPVRLWNIYNACAGKYYKQASKGRTLLIRDYYAAFEKVDVIAAVATAGIPHAAFIAQKLKMPLVYVRASKKGHGLENQVEGRIKRGQTVVVIEDLVSTGQSSTLAVKALRKLGANADNLLAIFTYDLKTAKKNFKKNKINFQALCNLETAANVAEKNDYLKKEQVKTILEWAKNPENWAKKMGFE